MAKNAKAAVAKCDAVNVEFLKKQGILDSVGAIDWTKYLKFAQDLWTLVQADLMPTINAKKGASGAGCDHKCCCAKVVQSAQETLTLALEHQAACCDDDSCEEEDDDSDE